MSVRAASVFGLALLTSLVLSLPCFAQALEDKVPEDDLLQMTISRSIKRGGNPLRPRITRYQGAAMEALGEEDYELANELLSKLSPKRMNPYERAVVYRLLAFVAYNAGDYELAIQNFQRVIDEKVLPPEDDNDIRYNIAQIWGALQNWENLAKQLELWFRYEHDPDPGAFYLLGLAKFQTGDVEAAIQYATTAIDSAPTPKESWLQLLAALYIQQQDYANSAPVLEELVIRYPKKAYWVQLSLIYGAQDEYPRSLAVQQIAHLQGFLERGPELRRLARSYLYGNLPYPAATILTDGLESGVIEPDAAVYELLANSWIAAREYDLALGPLIQAAELSEGGDLYVRLGQVHMQKEEWSTAVSHLRKAIEKGELKYTGNALLLLGIASFNNNDVDGARRAFLSARKHEETRKFADDWIDHISKETSVNAQS